MEFSAVNRRRFFMQNATQARSEEGRLFLQASPNQTVGDFYFKQKQ